MIRLQTPISEMAIRALKVGDEVLISGIGFTGRAVGLTDVRQSLP